MTKEDRAKFEAMYKKLEDFISEKADPGNGGWKTARAVFEKGTTDALQHIDQSLREIKECTAVLPDIIHDVKDLKDWRKFIHRVLWTIFTPILAAIGYLIASNLW